MFRPYSFILLTLMLVSVVAQADPPANFVDEIVVSGLHQPTALRFMPDGEHLLIMDKNGDVQITHFDDPPHTPTIFLDIPSVRNLEERGGLDLVLDPDFETNGYLYVNYTHDGSNTQRVSRFTASDHSADPATEFVVWADPDDADEKFHFGGGLDIGPDGMLYVTTGDRFVAARAQNLSSSSGKIIRIARDGTVPLDNPFHDGAGPNVDEIWAYGLRNPFRSRWDLPTSRFFVGEVGQNAFEDIHLGIAGANYGWPACEGICSDPAYTDPIFSYAHRENGASVIGGVVYRGENFPEEYAEVYFYGDFVFEELRYLNFAEDGETVLSDTLFATDVGGVVSVDQGPDGALYYLRFYDGELRRIRFISGNQPPSISSASADPVTGVPPLMVDFSVEASDPEDDELSYHWEFGDGNSSELQNPSHTYSESGMYEAFVQVSDADNSVTSDSITIRVGAPPTAMIVTPTPGTFRAGDVIMFSGTATDPDETLSGDAFEWELLFQHDDHSHPREVDATGMSGSFTIPTMGHDFADETSYELFLTVTDSDGLDDMVSVEIFPDKAELSLSSEPAGVMLSVSDIPQVAPFAYNDLIGFQHEVSAPEEVVIDEVTYLFDRWSDGGAREHTITIDELGTALTAYFVKPPASGEKCSLSVGAEFPPWLPSWLGILCGLLLWRRRTRMS